ncbi:MAG: hypothetical protein HYZ28_19300 [Myxococcales bacterium]|nr:hypothetical protein [Myxococcales bacterium]
MSETPEVAAAEAPAPAACPISAEALPPNMRKYVDSKGPVPLRMMAAKALAPLSPADMLAALFILTFDPDEGVRQTAEKSSVTLPDRILAPALRDEGVKPPVLGFFLGRLGGNDAYAEMLILNASTPDEAVAAVASKCGVKAAEIIGENQLRLLRHEDIVRQLCLNPNATPALIDRTCDFSVRSGLVLADVPQMKEARVRLFGPEAAENPPDPGPTADEILGEYSELADESASPMEEGKRLNATQRVSKMSIAEKIKLASRGNKEARGLLLRDANKLVAVAVIRSPRVTDGEVMAAANNRAMHDEVLRVVYSDREWTKMYPIKLALVKNPKVPQAIAIRFLATLRESDVKSLARDKNVPNAVQTHAKKMVDKKNAPSGPKH